MARQRATYKIFSGGVMAGTNVLVSQVIDTWMIDSAGLELQWTGTPTGAFTTEGSIQYDPANNPNATFVNIATPAYAPAIANPTGAPSQQLVAFSPTAALPFRYLRLRYTNASGAGVLDVWLNQTGAS